MKCDRDRDHPPADVDSVNGVLLQFYYQAASNKIKLEMFVRFQLTHVNRSKRFV